MEPDQLAATWDSYRADRDNHSRNLLTEHYQSVVQYVAFKIGKTLPPQVDRDDLITYGNFGLMDAISKYDSDKGVKFETYAVSRVRGAILDELRALDWVPRAVRSKSRDLHRAMNELQMELGRPPSDEELSLHMGITIRELWAVHSQQSMTWISDLSMSDTPSSWDAGEHETSGVIGFDRTVDVEQQIMSRDLGNTLAEAIDGMSDRAKIILSLYYCQEMTLAEIAEILGVTVSRVCQIQSKILQSLREELGHGVAQLVA